MIGRFPGFGAGRAVLSVLVLVGVLAGCAEQPDTDEPGADVAATSSSAGSAEAANGELRISIDRGDGSPVEEYRLVCADDARGTLPDPQAACQHLATVDEPFAPIPDDRVCTEQYGGPQTARVVGTWAGEPVDLSLSRTNGCLIAQWDSLGPLLPGPVGVLD